MNKELPNWTNVNILIAEDEEINYQLIRVALKRTGAHIFRANNGQEAVDFVKKNNHIHIILMDIQMPVMNGYQAIEIIKSINHDIPIIVQTAFAMASEKDRAYEVGCDDYVTKPINLDILVSKMKSLIVFS